MARSDTWRNYGFEADMSMVQVVAPVQTTNVTPVVWPSASTGIDTSTRGRKSILVIICAKRAAAGATYSLTESATTNGTYTACTTSGDLTKVVASGMQYVSVKPNPAKPFLRVTVTGDGASADHTTGVGILYL
jgi:hypothetical protein